jgi:hypothetical protein
MATDTFFVNRSAELERFQTFGTPVLVVCGEGGLGKSALLPQMERLCESRKVHIEWRSTKSYDFLGVMQYVADVFGGLTFNSFRDLVERFQRFDVTLTLRGDGRISVG